MGRLFAATQLLTEGLHQKGTKLKYLDYFLLRDQAADEQALDLINAIFTG